ncbi:MAG: GNAT family N-acetyltransferase [Anaerolineaceae bacterium]|nr:GNAT family N-acetyltransferase [Anaerolineaceae bacterium]
MERQYNAKEASINDLPKIKSFLNQNPLHHIHLDWGSIEQLINKNNFLMLLENEDIIGILSCPSLKDDPVWIRQFSIGKYHKPGEVWNVLFPKILESLSYSASSINIYSIAVWDWYERILKNAGFINVQQIVSLEWTSIRKNHPDPFTTPIKVRPMDIEDIPPITQIDCDAFSIPWNLNEETLNNAYTESSYSSVAIFDDTIVGYLIASQTHLNAHISRIAVFPDYQGRKIGQTLMAECLRYYIEKNILTISVNTQKSNIASLALYKKMGFEDLGNNFPVYHYSSP